MSDQKTIELLRAYARNQWTDKDGNYDTAILSHLRLLIKDAATELENDKAEIVRLKARIAELERSA